MLAKCKLSPASLNRILQVTSSLYRRAEQRQPGVAVNQVALVFADAMSDLLSGKTRPISSSLVSATEVRGFIGKYLHASLTGTGRTFQHRSVVYPSRPSGQAFGRRRPVSVRVQRGKSLASGLHNLSGRHEDGTTVRGATN